MVWITILRLLCNKINRCEISHDTFICKINYWNAAATWSASGPKKNPANNFRPWPLGTDNETLAIARVEPDEVRSDGVSKANRRAATTHRSGTYRN